jgi:hypothetical protein
VAGTIIHLNTLSLGIYETMKDEYEKALRIPDE